MFVCNRYSSFDSYCSLVVLPVVLLILTATFKTVYANEQQSPDNPDKEYIDTYYHIGPVYSNFGGGFQTGFSYRPKRYILTGRFLWNNEPTSGLFSPPSEKLWELGLLIGPHFDSNVFFASLSGGISLVGENRRGEIIGYRGSSWLFRRAEYEMNRNFTVGLSIESHFIWKVTIRVNFGFTLFANINALEHYAGGSFFFQIRLPAPGRD